MYTRRVLFTLLGDVKQPLTLTVEDLAKTPRATVRTNANRLDTVCDGVWLHKVLTRPDVPLGSQMRRKALAGYLLASAEDGYKYGYEEMLLADKADGKPLVGSQGPFRLVVAKDKSGARSVRMLNRIEVIQVRK